MAFEVEGCKRHNAADVSVLGGFPVPISRDRKVAWNAEALIIDVAEPNFGPGHVVLGR